MTDADLNIERLTLSERLVAAWEALFLPGIKPLNLSRLAAQEIAYLNRNSAVDPERVEVLISRLEDLVRRANRELLKGVRLEGRR